MGEHQAVHEHDEGTTISLWLCEKFKLSGVIGGKVVYFVGLEEE